MLTCVYQSPLSLSKNCLLKVNRETKKVIVSKFSEEKGGRVKVEIAPQHQHQRKNKTVGLSLTLSHSHSAHHVPEESESDAPLSETCGLSISELETMAARQARQLETQEQLLAAKAQRLRFLKSGGETERLQRLREKVATQEERLRKLRALRGKVQTNRGGNSVLSSDLESLRAVFNEKEKELSLAVAKVDELTRQLEELRRGSKDPANNGQSVAAVELEKLRRELMYRQKLREAQATRVAAQRAALNQRQEEALRVDRRIAELQERLHRKRLLNHQLASTLKHQDNVDDFVSLPTKNDPKYQTLPYNAKLFAPFASKHEQDNFEKSMQQMQIIQLDHLQSPHHHNNQNQSQQHNNQQQQSQNQAKSVNFSNNIQLHQLISQNHQNAKSANTNANNTALNQQHQHQQQAQAQQLQMQGVSQGTSSPIAASTTTATATIPNGLQTVHSTQANNNVSRGKAIPIGASASSSSENAFPLVRPSNFLPTGAPSSTGSSSSGSAIPNLGINGLPNSQVSNTKETSSTASNASASGSSVSDGFSSSNNAMTGMTMTGMSNVGAPGRPAKPALPPKPAKPTPPPRQAAHDAFPFTNQRLPSTSEAGAESTGSGNGIMPDRSELPIKPKPLFIKKGPPGGNISSSVSTSSISSNSNSSSAPASDKDSVNTTVRMSINRRIEMPPAFLFPESDPPPSDLVPEHQSSAINQNQQNTNLSSQTQSQHPSPPPSDTVDASPLLQKPSNQNQLIPEEYTLPDLFPVHPNLSNSGYTPLNNNKDTFFLNNLVNSTNNNMNSMGGGPASPAIGSTSSSVSSTTSSSLSAQNLNATRVNNNLNEIGGSAAAELLMLQQHVRHSLSLEEQSEMNKNNENCASVMSIHVNVGSETPKGETTTNNQLESIEAVREDGAGVLSNDHSPDRDENTSDSTTNSGSPSANAPGHLIVRRIKKGNLKSNNREHPPLGRRVSFDPLALLLDASLEGELELVVKTAGEVGNASAANDEGITALHNAICAGHADVVRFLVEFGCDVNAQDSDGWTPLHCAASCNNVGMVKFLVERGACIFATTLSDHETAAEKCEEDEDGFGPCSEFLYSIQEKLGIMNGGAVFAVFDYDAQNPDELSFREGDRLVILRKGDEFEREWWWATLGDQQGYVPRNLLGLYPRVVPQRRNES